MATLAVVLVAACGSGTSTGPATNGQLPDVAERLVEQVSDADAYGHLQALQRIADEHGGNRAAPSPGYQASVDYVSGALRSAGFDVSTPTYEIHRDEHGDEGRVALRNVIAQTRTGDPDHIVMIGAHLDSVPAGPGIVDNGSGVATLLEIANRLGASPHGLGKLRA